MKEEKKYPPVIYTVWQDVWTSITSPKKYLQWAFQPVWRSIKYLLFLQAVMAVVTTIVFYQQAVPALEQFKTWAVESLPVINYQNHEIAIENDETLSFSDSDNFFFKLDATQSLEEDPKIDVFYESGLLIVRDGIVLSQASNIDIFRFEDLPELEFIVSPETLSDMISRLRLSILIIFPFIAWAALFVSRMLTALLFSFVMVLFSGFKLKFKQVLNLAIYSLTPAILAGYLSVVLFGRPSIFSLVFVIYFVIAVSYLRKFTGLTISKS